MNRLTKLEIENLSFPDSDVENMSLCFDHCTLEIKTDSCYLNVNGGKRLFGCVVKLIKWRMVNISLYESSTEEIKILSPETADNLVDICEFEFGDKIIFKGFGAKTGQWVEYVFTGGEMSVTYDK